MRGKMKRRKPLHGPLNVTNWVHSNSSQFWGPSKKWQISSFVFRWREKREEKTVEGEIIHNIQKEGFF